MFLLVDSTKQFPTIQHPLTSTRNTECSVRLDTHAWELVAHAKRK